MNTDLRAGVSLRDITPQRAELFELFGIPRQETTRGVIQPLRLEALLLACGDDLLWVVTCDQLFMQESFTDPVRQRLAEAFGRDRVNVMFGATHCHSSQYQYQEPADMTAEQREAWDMQATELENACVEACLEAHAQLEFAEIATSTAILPEPLGHCRRMLLSSGACLEHWIGSSPAIPGEKRMALAAPAPDRIQLIALRLIGASEPFALLTSYPSHIHLIPLPLIHGEVAGAAKQEIERRHPGTTALYALGAAGDNSMNPTSPPPPEGDLNLERAWFEEQMQILGGRFANAIDRALDTLVYLRPDKLQFAEFESDEPHEIMLDFQPRGGIFIQAAAVGRAALLNIQGELFCEYGRQILDGSPYPHLVTIAYHERGYSYIGTDLAYEQGSYEIKGTRPRSEEEEQRLRENDILVVPAHRSVAGHIIVERSLEVLRNLANDA